MIYITEEQKSFLKENFVKFEDALYKNDLDALLTAIDDAIIGNILAHNDEPDEIGVHLQRIYDQIYNHN